TPSEERRHDLVGLGFRPEQVWVVPPVALGQEAFEEPSRPVLQREPLIVWLGKVRRYKCVHHAVEAMAHVARQEPAARLVIAGRRDDPGYERMLRQMIVDLGLAGRVDFQFDLSETAKFHLLGRARTLVVPSPVEGFGIVILEANACGTPAVVSQGVPVEAVRQGYNGLRVPFGDTTALAEALLRVLADGPLAESLSGNAALHARSFSKPSIQRQLEEIIQRAVCTPTLAPVSV
ncbi:MAG TPA: glycosyltransferase, partial [Dehalococcoidia bacterium]|nr:glycosyltransferase [Dehalococcoidia bacterium]